MIAFGAIVLAGCAGSGDRRPGLERMYVIDCGENHVKDLALWSAPDAGKSAVFRNHCYLIKHAKGWMLWDSGLSDRLAALPNGLTTPNGLITSFLKKPLAESLREIGVAPAEIQHFAMSHTHPDHSGNANLFTAATLYMQAAEVDAAFGPEPQKYNFVAASYEQLRGAKLVRLTGDHDVFGDSSVMIKSAPGHTPGHQVLFVNLARTGPVVLSGDMVHTISNWNAKRVPKLNFNVERSLQSMQMVEQLMVQTDARLWINHDPEQGASIPKAPAWVE
jgi:glyoxylase-like metal-dependent hydrolase (beta-lactamase superfamily II)